MSKFMRGSALLEGSDTTPGCHLTDEEKRIFSEALVKSRDYGLDFYPTIIQKVRYDEMSEIAAYGGFPHRYPHWYWGMQYEELQRGYEYNQHRIYELVVNTNPCVMYIMASNTLLDNVTVVFHATGHNDFFKNNIFFTPTDENMMNKLSSNAARIRKYISRWGRERVTEFIDHVLRIQTLIDPAKAWTERVIREPVIKDRRDYEHPRRLRVASDRLHMDPWINPKDFIDDEHKRIEENELAKELELFQISDKDIFGFLKDYAHLKPWQQDIISMLYEESMYFSPQRATKTINEGWASMMDYEFMTRQGYCSLGQKSHDVGIVEYAVHKMGVLGGKYSVNPYKTGFYLFLDVEERWNKGQFGTAYEECKDMKQKEDWDTKAGLGKEKIFEVRKYYNDVTFINEFFTQDFCNKFEYFEYKHYPNGEWKIEGRDAKVIKRKLLQKHVNGGLPDIRIADPNHRNKNYFLLQHYRSELDDRVLYDPYVRAVMTSIYYLWGKDVMLATTDKNNDEFVYVCMGTNPEKDVALLTREDYEKTWI
jgi:stage V sporulation protein R